MFEPLGPKLVDALEDNNFLDANVRNQAIQLAARTGSRLDEVLIKLGHLAPSTLNNIIATKLKVPHFSQRQLSTARLANVEISAQYCLRQKVIVLERDGQDYLAMIDPLDDATAKLIYLKLSQPLIRASIAPVDFEAAWRSFYPIVDETLHQSTPQKGLDKNLVEISDDDLNTLKDAKSDAPTVRYMADLVNFAALDGCSDIHVRPDAYGAEIFVRKNGILSLKDKIETSKLKSLISRLKVVAKLDLSETRLPQDGKFMQVVAGVRTDIRVATMPQIHGEGAVLRILGRQISTTRFQDLGFDDQISAEIEKLFELNEGLALVVGPTGSGKSTTLYTAINRLAQTERNIITIEDPVEIQKAGTNQVQVDESTGLTFPRALRAALRQDPDIILIGEIRDSETAMIAIQAALTGHIVLASLHTSSALSAIPRLIDMGVKPYLLSAVLKGVLAQRLLPKTCNSCGSKKETKTTNCVECRGTGIVGRQILGEIALLDEGRVKNIVASASDVQNLSTDTTYLSSPSIGEQAKKLFELGAIGSDQLHWV